MRARICPRKPLFLVCASMIALSQCAMATYTYLVPNDGGPRAHGWVPIATIISGTVS